MAHTTICIHYSKLKWIHIGVNTNHVKLSDNMLSAKRYISVNYSAVQCSAVQCITC